MNSVNSPVERNHTQSSSGTFILCHLSNKKAPIHQHFFSNSVERNISTPPLLKMLFRVSPRFMRDCAETLCQYFLSEDYKDGKSHDENRDASSEEIQSFINIHSMHVVLHVGGGVLFTEMELLTFLLSAYLHRNTPSLPRKNVHALSPSPYPQLSAWHRWILLMMMANSGKSI